MAITTPSARPAIWAESGDTTAPSTGEQQSGYVAGKPSRRKTNWLLNWLDNAVQYLLARETANVVDETANITLTGTGWTMGLARSMTYGAHKQLELLFSGDDTSDLAASLAYGTPLNWAKAASGIPYCRRSSGVLAGDVLLVTVSPGTLQITRPNVGAGETWSMIVMLYAAS